MLPWQYISIKSSMFRTAMHIFTSKLPYKVLGKRSASKGVFLIQRSRQRTQKRSLYGRQGIVLLMTCQVLIQGPDRSNVQGKALLDYGSETFFIMERLTSRMDCLHKAWNHGLRRAIHGLRITYTCICMRT